MIKNHSCSGSCSNRKKSTSAPAPVEKCQLLYSGSCTPLIHTCPSNFFFRLEQKKVKQLQIF